MGLKPQMARPFPLFCCPLSDRFPCRPWLSDGREERLGPHRPSPFGAFAQIVVTCKFHSRQLRPARCPCHGPREVPATLGFDARTRHRSCRAGGTFHPRTLSKSVEKLVPACTFAFRRAMDGGTTESRPAPERHFDSRFVAANDLPGMSYVRHAATMPSGPRAATSCSFAAHRRRPVQQ